MKPATALTASMRPDPKEGDGRGDHRAVPPTFIFAGERRSRRAILLGVRCEDGRLAARTLHEAVRAAGLDPGLQVYRNVYCDDDPRVVDSDALAELRALSAAGAVVVGMGRAAQAALKQAGIPHLQLIHPAARGAIRARAAYHAHVAAVLGTGATLPCPDPAVGCHTAAAGTVVRDAACTHGNGGCLEASRWH